MFAKHGFQNIAEKANLGRFVLEKISSVDVEKYSAPERLRMCFEQLGPTFVKLGQLLATRPDLVPPEVADEFKKLHSNVPALEFSEIEQVLFDAFGDYKKIFSEFDTDPIGAASIAQVYKATLISGEKVVVKIQRPGIEGVINEDLNVLYTLAELADRYLEEAKLLNPIGIVDEFFKTLELETNFIVEANNIRRFQENFKDVEDVHIPKVYGHLTSSKVLVMEAVQGIPLSSPEALKQEGVVPEQVLKVGLKTYLKMVFNDGLFHGDLHAGNMFIMPHNHIALIDFGVVGRLNSTTQTAIANMFVAMAMEDYEKLAYEYVDIAPYTGVVDIDRFARELRDLFAPYYGLTLKNVNLGKLLMESAAIAAKYRLTLPSELILFFKSIVTIEGMGRQVMTDFDFLSQTLEFAGEIVNARYKPLKLAKEIFGIGRDINELIISLPRQLRQILKRLNDPNFTVKIELDALRTLTESIEKSGKSQFAGLVVGSLILSSTFLVWMGVGPTLLSIPVLSLMGYGMSAFLTMIFLFK